MIILTTRIKLFKTKTEKKMSYEIQHNSYSSAVTETIRVIQSKGFEVSDEEIFQHISIGGKPGIGQTKRASLEIAKGGKVQKKAAQMQVYGLDSGRFELNFYIL